MVNILLLLAMLAAAVGAFMLSEATMGVGIIGLALFLSVLARIVQAQHHHDENGRAAQPNPTKRESGGFGPPAPM